MKRETEEILKSLSLDEKIALLTGSDSMSTESIDRLGIKGKNLLTVLTV